MAILVPVSLGELYDKWVILHIKFHLINDETKKKNIKTEIEYLRDIVDKLQINSHFWDELYDVNSKLWEIEDKIRIKEKNHEFDDEFIQLARSVYYTNDKRSEIKREINLKYDSNIIEEKSYEGYS